MSAVRIGEAGPIFGTTDVAYGYIESVEKSTEVQESEITDGDGDIVGVDQYGKKTNVSFEYTFRAIGGPGEASVGAGTTITVPDLGGECYVRTATETKSKAPGYLTYRIEGTIWPDLIIAP